MNGNEKDRREFLGNLISFSASSLLFSALSIPTSEAQSNRKKSVIIPPGVTPSVFSEMMLGHRPCPKVYEDQYTFCFLARDEIRLGHVLVVPKIQIDKFWEVPEPYYSAVFKAAKRISQAVLVATECQRVGTLIHGLEVPHFHYHIVPMFQSGDLRGRAPYRPSESELKPMQEKIILALRNLS